MCKISSEFKSKVKKYKQTETFNGMQEGYLLIHTSDTIGVFKHKKHNNDFIVWNVKKEYDEGHSHFKSKNVAVIVADNIGMQRKPKRSTCIRNLESYLRVAESEYKFYQWVSDLKLTKIDKKLNNNKYYNVGTKGKAS